MKELLTLAIGPLQATITIPLVSSSAGYLTTFSELSVSGGTDDCHGRLNVGNTGCNVEEINNSMNKTDTKSINSSPHIYAI